MKCKADNACLARGKIFGTEYRRGAASAAARAEADAAGVSAEPHIVVLGTKSTVRRMNRVFPQGPSWNGPFRRSSHMNDGSISALPADLKPVRTGDGGAPRPCSVASARPPALCWTSFSRPDLQRRDPPRLRARRPVVRIGNQQEELF